MKSKGKGKQKKKGKSRKSRDEWAFEGGQVYEDSDVNANGKRTLRKTQSHDEKMRRGRRKMFENAKKHKTTHKLSSKVSFKDVLDSNVETSDMNVDNGSKKKPLNMLDIKVPDDPNVIFNKLRDMLKKENKGKSILKLIDTDNHQLKSNSSINNSTTMTKSTNLSDLKEIFPTSNHDPIHASNTTTINIVDEPVEDNQNNDLISTSALTTQQDDPNVEEEIQEIQEEQLILQGKYPSAYHYFFASSNTIDTATSATTTTSKNNNTMQLIKSTNISTTTNTHNNNNNTNNDEDNASIVYEYDIFGNIRHSKYIYPITTYNDITNIPKLWRSQKQSLLPTLSDQILLPYLTSYVDMFLEHAMVTNQLLPEDDSPCIERDILQSVLLHSMIHIVRARTKLLKNNYKLKKKKEAELIKKTTDASLTTDTPKKKKSKKSLQESITTTTDTNHDTNINGNIDADVLSSMIQDQGYVRPRILILCPFRSSVRKIVKLMSHILGENTTISSWDKFLEEYGNHYDDDDNDNDSINNYENTENKSYISQQKRYQKPSDYQNIFYDNVDDDFKLGIQINPGQGKSPLPGGSGEKGVYMRLYSDFYLSDIIIASPIGLKFIIENNETTHINYDYLTSLEMIFLYQSDILYMQNWDHIDYILKLCNKLPQQNHETDFNRVRPYFLENQSYQHRQLIMMSSYNVPCIQATFRQYATSLMGQIKLKYNWNQGSINQIYLNVKQIFQKIPCQSYTTSDDDKFAYFKQHILTPIIKYDQIRTLIVVPSYFDYIRVRNELMRREVDAAYICEYSRESEISRGRSRFFHGQKKVLVYSGRAHFFRRFQIRGAMHVIFYSLPEYPHFYSEFVNTLREADYGGLSAEISSVALLTMYEKMALERIVGNERCHHILFSKKCTFIFK